MIQKFLSVWMILNYFLGDGNSFEEAVLTINDFGKRSGLFLNTGKPNAVSSVNNLFTHSSHDFDCHFAW